MNRIEKDNSIYCFGDKPQNYIYRIQSDKDTKEPTATKELLEECKKVSEKYKKDSSPDPLKWKDRNEFLEWRRNILIKYEEAKERMKQETAALLYHK